MSTTGHETEVIQVHGLKEAFKDAGNKAIFNEATCSTAGGTAAKVTNTVPPSFSLVSGATIIVKFTYAISVAGATLNVGETGAKPIYYRGAALPGGLVAAGAKLILRYNGTAYEVIGNLSDPTLPARVEALEAYFSSSADADAIINKWTEIVAFLNGIAETDTLSGLLNDISNSIPTELSELSEDATHRTVTDTEKAAWGSKQDSLNFNTAYDASTNKAATMADIPVIEDFHEAVATLQNAPTSSTLTYTRDGVTYNYKIGDEVRVADQEAEEGYKFYKLYDITGTAPNQEAVWGGLGSGGGSVTITGTIVVNLEEYINNSKTAGSGLVGVVITLTNTSDSETVGTHTIVSGETGYTFSDLTPMKNYSVSVSALSGYTQPEAQTVSELGIGTSVTKTFQYEANEYTIAITSDQGASDPAISEAVVTINGTDYENGDTIKFATGTSQSDIEALCSATDVLGYTVGITVNTTNKTITVAYEEQKGIDLGLPSGILWAEANVGAENPEDAGLYFSWGNVVGHTPGDGYSYSDANYALTDGYNLTSDIPQDAVYDAARANMGAPWMMASQTLFQELIDNCTWSWTTRNGVWGYLVTSNSNNNSIFLPAAGLIDNDNYSVQTNGRYFASTYGSSTTAYRLGFGSTSKDVSNTSGTYRRYGMTIRGVRYPNTIRLRLTTTDNSSNAGIIVEVSDGSSITWYLKTDSNGAIKTSLPNGTYTLTSFSHSLNVSTVVVSGNATVNISATKMEYVDLGLPSGIKWATCNLGASSPTEHGDYFSWGNIIGHAENSGYSFDQTTYNSTPGASLTASISSSDAAHDAALAIKGSPWRMPTGDDFQELYDNTDSEWVVDYNGTGVTGRKFMKKTDHSVYVFFPASGLYDGTSLNDRGSGGFYLSSSWNSSASAYYLNFYSSSVSSQYYYGRRRGFSIRPVQ